MMRILCIIFICINLLNATEFEDIDKTITFNMWGKNTSPTNYDVSYLEKIIKNINKLEKTNRQLDEVLNRKKLKYMSYSQVEKDFNKIVKKNRISTFFYNFEKAQIILILQIAQKSSVYESSYSYKKEKEPLVKGIYAHVFESRDTDATLTKYKNFRTALRGYQMTNFMLEKAFGLLPKVFSSK